MCGRYTQMISWADLVRLARLVTPVNPDFPLFHSFNVAPTQNVLIVREGKEGPEAAAVRWGLVPEWADDPAIGSRMINARAETVSTKPAFREAFRQRRCLVPANGFYEWMKPATKSGKKQPLYIRLKSDEPFAFAGLWERWDRTGQTLDTCTIVTCEPNELVSQFHTRMPVILPHEKWGDWLSGSDLAELQSLLVPYPADELVAYPVSPRVNTPKNNDASCIEPLAATDSSDGGDSPVRSSLESAEEDGSGKPSRPRQASGQQLLFFGEV